MTERPSWAARNRTRLPVFVLAGLCLLVAGALMIAACSRNADVRKYVRSAYPDCRDTSTPPDFTCRSPHRTVRATADDIARHVKPADTLVQPTATFLRYRDTMVSVTSAQDGAITVGVEDAARGYRNHYGYVGGWWGRYSGPGETFRGGGPGSGK